MTDKARILAKNIRAGSGNHGLTEDQLYEVLKGCTDIEQFAYSLKKCAEVSSGDYFVTQEQTHVMPDLTKFTEWHHIDEPWNADWGFDKTHPGCYIYGLFENSDPVGPADFLSAEVIYIGESRATSRNSMLGRRTDFKGTIRNERLSPYGCGTAFKNAFNKELVSRCFQAYLPMHPSLCKTTEVELLGRYYDKYGHIPVCNPPLDLSRVKKNYIGV